MYVTINYNMYTICIRNMARSKSIPLLCTHIYSYMFSTMHPPRLAHLSPSWLVSIPTSLSQHLAKQGFNTWHKLTSMWKTSWDLSHWEAHDNQPHQKQHMLISQRFFLLESGTLSISQERKLDYLRLKDFHKFGCELYLKQPLTPP